MSRRITRSVVWTSAGLQKGPVDLWVNRPFLLSPGSETYFPLRANENLLEVFYPIAKSQRKGSGSGKAGYRPLPGYERLVRAMRR